MAEISLDNVRKVYPGGVAAIQGISLDIADGEMIVLVGPSGCGKSTLLRMVAGLETVTSGEIRIAGKRVNDLEPADRDIAMVFQTYALYPHMTVFDNMAYGLRNRGTATAEIDRRVQETARTLQLDHLLQRRPRQLSGGQRQRVAMGRAIVRQPAAFLFDEPLSNLDAKLRVQMRIEIRRLQRKLTTTSLYVTHDQLEAMTLGDRLVVMNGGRVEQVGTPMEVYSRPASVFVAGFIGSPAMNILDAQTIGKGIRITAQPDTVWTGPNGTPALPQNLRLGVRPEDLSIAAAHESADTTPTGTISLRLTVTGVELIGHESFIHGLLDDGHSELVVRIPGQASFESGTKLMAQARASAFHAFDADRGARLALA
ncbi:MAG: sn-glycerol-3-phosphate import ATP-binding protein UgpC [Geminicoccaceae bacterium]|nr:sn-glycerol-3-phosphate import ATP-binding protein UgpC [Geminicoccaceae bacterium]